MKILAFLSLAQLLSRSKPDDGREMRTMRLHLDSMNFASADKPDSAIACYERALRERANKRQIDVLLSEVSQS